MRNVVIMGAGGRDFHDFNVVFRNDPDVRVVAFTAAQIPGIESRTYPTVLAGPHYPDGIGIHPEADLEALVAKNEVDEVVLAYSDLSHEDVMHKASRVLASGADFRLLGPRATMLRSTKPVVAICAVRTGAGKSPLSRRVATILRGAGLRAVLVRHPMPYGDLAAMTKQRFATLEDIDAAHPTIEEREEYEEPVREGMVMYAGVDYEAILADAEREADVIIWDGGNNDFPFFAPDVLITVADALRPGHELSYHPGETNFRMADVIVINKVDAADERDVDAIVAAAASVNPSATIVRCASIVALEEGPSLQGARVLVVEDGPTLTHGGMPFGAGTVAAKRAGAEAFVDPRPYAVGSIAETFLRYPALGSVLPAMGYGAAQIADLEATLEAVPCDVIVSGTPTDLARIIDTHHPIRRATYEVSDVGVPTLDEVLEPHVAEWVR